MKNIDTNDGLSAMIKELKLWASSYRIEADQLRAINTPKTIGAAITYNACADNLEQVIAKYSN